MGDREHVLDSAGGLNGGASVRELTASGFTTVESVQWIGQQALKVIFRDALEGRAEGGGCEASRRNPGAK